MSIGSSDEMRVWLDYGRDLGYLDASQVETWANNYIIIARMLHALMERWE